jgi:hypothetical protein
VKNGHFAAFLVNVCVNIAVSTLFFAALGGKLVGPRSKAASIVIAALVFSGTVIYVLTLPNQLQAFNRHSVQRHRLWQNTPKMQVAIRSQRVMNQVPLQDNMHGRNHEIELFPLPPLGPSSAFVSQLKPVNRS